jgi:hypothetical protein
MDTLHLPKKRKAKSPRQSRRAGVSTQHTRVGGAETGADSEECKLPHERDESVTDDASEPLPSQRRVAEQARRDIERGLEDTDCRSDHGEGSACPPRPKKPSS